MLQLWREFEPAQSGPEYLFLDEIQVAKDWQTWLKHQVDFEKGRRRIMVTGSAPTLAAEGQESGVGRWRTIRLATLSFYECLRIRKSPVPSLPEIRSFQEVFDWDALGCAVETAFFKHVFARFYERTVGFSYWRGKGDKELPAPLACYWLGRTESDFEGPA